eukprot:TRINITY_DN7168_c0_g2_i2.p1 TRINITY_DN7168_c0_g2~~TRINITY_DN7168_c0_g2_i2.p1  ORF type:complete len:600 (+),score=119.08 TRINITY_DN7168_c0_g2_i2:195-1994(+)
MGSDMFQINLPARKLVVFVASTTGQGDPPDHAVKFWRYMKRTLPDKALANVSFTVLGLGDSNYDNFCNMGKLLDQRLEELSGHRFYPLGKADDATGLDQVVDPWVAGLWSALKSEWTRLHAVAVAHNHAVAVAPKAADPGAMPSPARLPVAAPKRATVGSCTELASRRVIWETDQEFASHASPVAAAPSEAVPCADHPFVATIQKARMLTRSDYGDKRILELRFDLTGYPCDSYVPGDSLAVFAENSPELVDALLVRLNLDPHRKLRIVGDCLPQSLAQATTARCVLSRCLDLTTLPKKTMLKALAEVCTDVQERDRFLQLAGSDAAARTAYNTYIAERPNLLHILNDVPSATPTLDLLIQHLPALQPRMYSATTTPLSDPLAIEVAFSMAQYQARGEVRDGVCTTYLAQLVQSLLERSDVSASAFPTVPVFIRRASDFRMPADVGTPIVMIGAGTGVSPFLSFVKHRAALRATGQQVGEAWLFFGCRHEQADFIYREELERAVADGSLTRLVTAFSRDQTEKIYVTNRLIEHGADVARLILQANATVYVCGDAKGLVKSARQTVVDILTAHGGMDSAQASKTLLEMSKAKRYVLDIWG